MLLDILGALGTIRPLCDVSVGVILMSPRSGQHESFFLDAGVASREIIAHGPRADDE
jgi:hypothetical protein